MARRTKWRLHNGRWTRSLGERGVRIRLFQFRRDGTFYRDVWLPGRGKQRKCLHTHDRNEAEQIGRALLAALLQAAPTVRPGRLTLGDLWRRYRQEAPSYLDNAPSTQRDAESRAAVLLAFFGDERNVRTLCVADQAAYTAARVAGGITCKDGRITRPVRARSVEADLVLLHLMLNWAATVRVGGVRLLDGNPLAGVRREREKNPRRPVATWERFQATRAAMQRLASRAEDDRARVRWTKMELALVLAEATGRGLGSIRQLRWEDIDFEARTIRWRAEADKRQRDWVIPLAAALAEELKRFRKRLGSIAGWLFAAEQKPEQPMDRHLFEKWLAKAEKEAKLAKLNGGLWHPYRRKWGTERKHLSIKDVAAAGGWKDTATLVECYQQPTNETLLAVMSEERKVREIAVSE